MSVVIVTGTDTGVGKTITTAMLAYQADQMGIPVGIYKPVQTGHDDDLATITRLSGLESVRGLSWYSRGLNPASAAYWGHTRLPRWNEIRCLLHQVDRPGQLTLLEGAGGLLVELTEEGMTLRDMAVLLDSPVIIVTRPDLGTLNHTSLTLEALHAYQLRCAGLVIGSWPADPDPIQRSNYDALGALAPIRAVIPAGIGHALAEDFRCHAQQAFDSTWIRLLVV